MKQEQTIGEQISEGVKQVKKSFLGAQASKEQNILSVIREDHKPLKELIQTMKDDDKAVSERFQAFQEFAPLLLTHAKAEEKSLYEFMKTNQELRAYAFEGDTEHSMADQLCEEIKRTTDQDQLGAKIKVLAEAVEHHIKEEEEEIFPDVEDKVEENALMQLTQKYTAVQAEIISQGQDDSPHESELDEESLH